MKKNTNNTNYYTNSRDLQLLIDESFAEKVIPENDSVRLLDKIVEEMDLSALYGTYACTGRPTAIPPSTTLKIMLYASMEGVRAPRQIQKCCKRDINYIWLLNGAAAPEFNHFERFRRHHLSKCGDGLLSQLVRKLKELGEIRFEHLFVDGTKIEANANKYSFVWKKSVTKYETRLVSKLERRIPQLCEQYGIWAVTAEDLLLQLEGKVTIPFVHGRGKRKSQLQRDIEELQGLLQRKEKYSGYQGTFGDRNSFSKTDPDATFMHMKEDHMRNSQLKPGYNIQFGVEGEYIVGVDVSSERNDQNTLIPLLEQMEKQLGVKYQDVTADAGYESEENYSYLEEKDIGCYIKPSNYERSKTKKFKSNMALRENMAYDADADEYTCQNGMKLQAKYVSRRESKTGFVSQITHYECESCEGCPYKHRCTKAEGNRKITVSKRFIEQRAESLKRITSETGIQLRMNRSIQSEGAFGVVKEDYNFRRFLTRGKRNIRAEILLVAMGYDIRKLHAKIQQNRTKTQLFKKVSA